MAKLADLGEVISIDVLIVGGGISGLVAAIKAREYPVDVLVVERETAGWAGKAPKGGGFFWVLTQEDDLDKVVEYHVRNIGVYLEDQELLYSYLSEAYGAVEQLGEWGVNVMRDAKGKLDVRRNSAGLGGLAGLDLDMQLPLRAKARKMGAKILSKVEVVELLKQDDRVVGAVGFNVIDGRLYIFKAKATILANGSCNYKTRRMWYAGSGDGIAAAYRAGAEMRNAEFSNSCSHVLHKDTESSADRRYLFNVLGENISKRYEPEVEPDVPMGDSVLALVLGMEKEVKEGRGPIFEDVSQRPPTDPLAGLAERYWARPQYHDFRGRQEAKRLKYGPPPSQKREVTLFLHAELGPIKVDHEMKTSLAGLWAIGDASWAGSCWIGAAPPPGMMRGSGLLNAALSAMRGGPAAARFASKGASPEVNYAEVKELKQDIFAPMRADKGLLPDDAIYAIQNAVCPLKYSVRRSKDRMEEALSKIKEVQQRLPELWAKDGHGLCKCHEVKSMAVCAEMSFRMALMRTESRGWHLREDYPERDDLNWRKWIIIKQEAGRMVLSTEPMPIDKYKVKP